MSGAREAATRHYRARGAAETTNAEYGVHVRASRVAVRRRARAAGHVGRMILNVER